MTNLVSALRILSVIAITFFSFASYANTSPLVGSFSGQFGVSPGGAATYSVPIELPPTVGGLNPGLSIEYNSQIGNGVLGVGWGLSGASSISRCPTSLIQDGYIDGVDFDNTDQYCLDGQRLIKNVDGSFSTQTESFSRISVDGNPSNPTRFIVETKAAEKITYEQGFSTAEGTIEWLQSSTEDSTGKMINYVYSSDSTWRLQSINFGHVVIDLNYEVRDDSLSVYQVGASRNINSYRINSVNVNVNNIVEIEYKFTYDIRTDLSQLIQIEKCIKGSCLQPISFTHESSSSNALVSNSSYAPPFHIVDTNGSDLGVRFIDVSGDGLVDMVYHRYLTNGSRQKGAYINTGSGWKSVPDYTPPFHIVDGIGRDLGVKFVELNGDGLIDIAYHRHTGGAPQKGAYLNTGSGWEYAADFVPPFHISGPSGEDYGARFVDLNGDGLGDFVYHRYLSNGGRQQGAYINTGSGWSSNSNYIPPFHIVDGNSADLGARFIDVNGDGLTDFIYHRYLTNGSRQQGAYLNNGNGWSIANEFIPPFHIVDGIGNDMGVKFVELNGDGLIDIAYHRHTGSTPQKGAYLNTGKGWQYASQYVPPFHITGPSGEDLGARFVDIDGDGLTDFLHNRYLSRGNSQKGAYLNTGHGWLSNSDYIPSHHIVDGLSRDMGARFHDLNGDGTTDVVHHRHLSSPQIGAYLARKKWGAITNIEAKNAPKVQINYDSTGGDKLFYSPASSYEYTRAVGFTRYVVTSFKEEILNDVYQTTSYYYKGLSYDLSGRNGAAFDEIHQINNVLNTKSVSTYNKTYPYAGTLISTSAFIVKHGQYIKVSDSNSNYANEGSLLNRMIAGNNLSYSEAPIFAYPAQSTQRTYNIDAPGTLMTEVITHSEEFDDFGNPERIRVETKDVFNNKTYQTLTENTYTNDTTNWHLGRLTHAKATHTHADGTSIVKESSFEYYDYTTGLLKKEIVEPNNPSLRTSTSYQYDQYGNKTHVTFEANKITYNADGTENTLTPFTRTTVTEYNAAADGSYPAGLFPTKVTNALGHSETRIYDPVFGKVLSSTGPNLITTTWEYDELGRATKQIPQVGATSTTSYQWCKNTAGVVTVGCPDAEGYYIESQVEGSAPARVYYDSLGRQVRKESTARNNQTIWVDTEYDNLGRVSKVYEPYFSTDGRNNFTMTNYDWAQRAYQVIRPDGKTASTTTFNGFETSVTDVKGRVSSTLVNGLGQTVRKTDPDLNTIDYTYDATSNLLNTTTTAAGSGSVTNTLEYDLRGNKTRMVDPDMGEWHYRYNALGELVWQKDAKGQIITMAYDALGRMTSRSEAEGTSTWVYDDPSRQKSIGKLSYSTGALGNRIDYYYGPYGRLSSTTTHTDNQSFTVSRSYDTLGRLDVLTYPAGFAVQHAYDTNGFLSSVYKPGHTDHQYWRPGSVHDARGMLKTQYYGHTAHNDGIQVWSNFHAINPWLTSNYAYANGNLVQDFAYTYDNGLDQVGNLTQREDKLNNLTEAFTFDNLDRVLTSVVTNPNGSINKTFAYDGRGNITNKSDVGAYTYGQGLDIDGFGPHMLKQAGAHSYTYDANGNILTGANRTVTWSSYNKPNRITNGTRWAEYVYNGNRNRVLKVSDDGTRTVFIGLGGKGNVLFEKETKAGNTVLKNHIYVGGKRIAVHMDYGDVLSTDTANEIVHYILTDHLGSVTTIVNHQGNVVTRKSFDVWGKSRNATTWADGEQTDTDNHRGYTGHEMIQEVGLIHMNGRIYDPTIARFMSADPHIQAPGNVQSYNRYAYVWNNPLANTDPSGFILKKIGKELSRAGRSIRKAGRKLDREVRSVGGWGQLLFNPHYTQHKYAVRNVPYYAQVSTIAAGAACGPVGFVCSSFVSGLNTSLLGGSAGDVWNSIGSGLLAGIASYAAGHMGGSFFDKIREYKEFGLEVGRAGLHAIAQGGVAEAQGQSFKSGAISGFSSSIVPIERWIDGGGNGAKIGRVVVSSIVGGTASELSGGKFVNGAVTGAFVRLFNHEINQANLGDHFKNALIAIGGGIQTVAGGMLCATGLGCLAGGPLIVLGVSNIGEGATGLSSYDGQGFNLTAGAIESVSGVSSGDAAAINGAVNLTADLVSLNVPKLAAGSWRLWHHASQTDFVLGKHTMTRNAVTLQAGSTAFTSYSAINSAGQ